MKKNRFNKLILVSFAVLSIQLLTSCSKKNCDGFPDKNFIHIPYQIDDILIFENGMDTIKFRIVESDITDPYTITTSFPMENNDECEYYAFFKTSRDNTYGYVIEDGYHDFHRVTFSTNNQIDIYEMSNTNTYSNEQELDSITINGFNYENVYLMEKDTANSIITKVLKAPNHGIIQFVDHSNGFTWNKIN